MLFETAVKWPAKSASIEFSNQNHVLARQKAGCQRKLLAGDGGNSISIPKTLVIPLSIGTMIRVQLWCVLHHKSTMTNGVMWPRIRGHLEIREGHPEQSTENLEAQHMGLNICPKISVGPSRLFHPVPHDSLPMLGGLSSLVNVYITMEHHHFYSEHSLCLRPFSKAM